MDTIMPIAEFADLLTSHLNFNLYPKQKEILISFYEKPYDELIMILGRRSGKDILTSIIAAYELYRLIKRTEGDPWKYYSLFDNTSVTIGILSCTNDQAKVHYNEFKRLFTPEILTKLFPHINFSYFVNRLVMKCDRNLSTIQMLFTGSSNEDIIGKKCASLIYNEFASMKNAKKLYFALPKTSLLNGGRQIICSTSDTSESFLYELSTCQDNNKLVVQYPTWEINESVTEYMLREQNNYLTTAEFDKEFGSIWSTPENISLSMRLSGELVNKLKKIARKKAYEQDKDISYVDLIREAALQYVQENENAG